MDGEAKMLWKGRRLIDLSKNELIEALETTLRAYTLSREYNAQAFDFFFKNRRNPDTRRK